jgi:hypothetical protein
MINLGTNSKLNNKRKTTHVNFSKSSSYTPHMQLCESLSL